MTYPPLLWASELTGFPGAPFAEALVEAAGERIRDACGWHIAPVVSETVTVDVKGSGVVVLPTRMLVNVTEIRDVSGSAPVVLPLTGWLWQSSGVLESKSWTRGCRRLQVDISHGYTKCPASLLPWAAQLTTDTTGGVVVTEQVGGVSTTYSAGAAMGHGGLSKYALPVIV